MEHTTHFPELISGLLTWSQEQDSRENHTRLLRKVASEVASRLEQQSSNEEFICRAVAGLMQARNQSANNNENSKTTK